jgi:hypothetical protein
MLTLPGEYWGLVRELTPQVRNAEAGLLTAEQDDDPDLLWAALDEACRRAGKRVRRGWVGHDRAALAWLQEDDVRLQLAPWLTVVGVTAPSA